MLFVAGSFDTVNGSACPGLAALHLSSGTHSNEVVTYNIYTTEACLYTLYDCFHVFDFSRSIPVASFSACFYSLLRGTDFLSFFSLLLVLDLKMPAAAWPTYWSEGGGQWECLAADPKYTFSVITAMIYAPSARTLFVAGKRQTLRDVLFVQCSKNSVKTLAKAPKGTIREMF